MEIEKEMKATHRRNKQVNEEDECGWKQNMIRIQRMRETSI